MTYRTEKKEELLSFLSNSGGQALTIDEICREILDGDKGKSTVYRLISRLVDDGRVRRISDGKTRRVTYQYIAAGHCAEHLHLKCKECGRLFHLDGAVSKTLEKRILKINGFEIDEGALLYGKCKSCVYTKGGAYQ